MPRFEDFHLRINHADPEIMGLEKGNDLFMAFLDEIPRAAFHAFGETQEEAIIILNDSFTGFCSTLEKMGKPIPEPLEDPSEEYSGRVTLRMTPMLHRDLVFHAGKNRVSLNSFIVNGLSQFVTVKNVAEIIRDDVPADRCPVKTFKKIDVMPAAVNGADYAMNIRNAESQPTEPSEEIDPVSNKGKKKVG